MTTVETWTSLVIAPRIRVGSYEELCAHWRGGRHRCGTAHGCTGAIERQLACGLKSVRWCDPWDVAGDHDVHIPAAGGI